MTATYLHIWPLPEHLTTDAAEDQARDQLRNIANRNSWDMTGVVLEFRDDIKTLDDDGEPYDGPTLTAKATVA
jgi:hypothetical protein